MRLAIDKHLDRFGIYLRLLGEFEGNHERAWLAAFPALSPEQLDADLWDWIQEQREVRERMCALSIEDKVSCYEP
jgi:hypothetical protein